MELPLGGPALRHYTRSRPRPHRQNQHLRPSRPQELLVDNENGVPDHMGRVDEGVEEFFTKRVLPVDTLKTQNEAGEPSITEQEVEVAPTSAAPCPAPSRTLRRKLGEFFTLKKRRAVKSEGSQEGKAKKTSIADLIRPLREATRAEKDKVKENEKVKEKESVDDNIVTGDPVEAETPPDGPTPLRGEAPPRRALREGKSQSLILLSGSAANAGNTKNTAQGKFQKHSSDGHHGFEQRLQLMLQRIGVSKAQPGETQSQEREMKKAESEGTIIDNKPEPPPTFMKPRTMSTSSDTRRPVRQSVSAHESADDLNAERVERNKETEKEKRSKEEDVRRATGKEKEQKSLANYIDKTIKEEKEEGLQKVDGIMRQGVEGTKSNEGRELCKKDWDKKREGGTNGSDEKEFNTKEVVDSKSNKGPTTVIEAGEATVKETGESPWD
uniref:capping protein, Arp2/3 and myosin-I linker protein 2-like n=1 Tax=Oncorhynchus gorbuscha TaxID=8017 RepID=UPI001EAEE5AC|nr:capping protein, Arp2/3 and myosin-I linker protein 2-like [Oncorhynchus gorbuscha]